MPAPISATKNDLQNLRDFALKLGETDWNPDVEPYGPCRRASRLVKLGWLVLHRSACASHARGMMGSSYHPATYRLTDAGKVVAATPA